MKNIIFIIALFSIFTISSQNFNYQNELERMVKVPNTLEAEAFAKYGNTSVNMYSGTPNISIPIYTISGRELDLPINLTYDTSGVKVAQLASQAGLSWNLNVGGRISRTINGLVDDYFYIAPSSSTYTSIYSNILSSYTFDYFPPEYIPSRESLSRDYLGLQNRKNNTVLYPAVTVNGTSFNGANPSFPRF